MNRSFAVVIVFLCSCSLRAADKPKFYGYSLLMVDTNHTAFHMTGRQGADPEHEGHYDKQVLDCISQLAPPLRLATMSFLAARTALRTNRRIHRAAGRRRGVSTDDSSK